MVIWCSLYAAVDPSRETGYLCFDSTERELCISTLKGTCVLEQPCLCLEGFTHNAETNVCEDVNECAAAYLNNCDADAACTNTAGSFSCACNTGFKGDGKVCSEDPASASASASGSGSASPWKPAVPSIALLCKSTSYDLTVTFPKPTAPFAQKNNVKIGSETTPAAACVAENVVVQAKEIVSKLTVDYTPGGCGQAKTIVNNNDKIEYTAPIEIIVRQQKTNLERSYVYKYTISCTLTRKQTESSDVEYTVTNSAVDKTEAPTAEEYSLAVALNFYSSTDVKHEAEFALTNKETLKGVIEETDGKDAALKFSVQECTLSNKATAGAAGAETATIITSECPIDESVTIVPDATDQDKFSFETRAITLASAAANDKYSVHCTLYICLTAESLPKCVQSTVDQCKASVKPPPKRRRRRNTDGISELSRTEVVTSMQSFYLLDKAAMMECPQESVYDEVRDKCSFERVFKVRGIFMDNEWSDSYQNTSSSAYANFVRITERRLRALIFVTGADDVIRGARVIGVRRGGVILDALFSHAAHVDAATAFERLKVVLFETPPTVTRIVTELKLQRSTEIEWVPLLINNASSINSNIMVVVIVAAVAVVALIGCGVTYMVKTRGSKGPEIDIGMVNGGLEKA